MGGTWSAVTPVISFGGVAGKTETSELMTVRLCFFAVILIVALLTAATVLTGRDFSRRLPAPRHTLWWLLPAAFVALSVVRPVQDFAWESDPPQVCRQADSIQYCVHKAHEWALAALMDDVEQTLTMVGRENVPFNRVLDYSLSNGSMVQEPHTLNADISAQYGIGGVRSTIIDQISATDVCYARYGNQDIAPTRNAFMLSVRLNGAREDGPDNRFGPLSDDQLRQWLSKHLNQVRTCDITDDLLP